MGGEAEGRPAAGRVREGSGLMAAAPMGRSEVHHRVPRCLLKVYDRAQGSGLEPEDLQAWFD